MKVFVAVLALFAVAGAEVTEDFGEYFENFKPNITLSDITFTLYQRKHNGSGIQMFLGDKESIKKAGFDPKLPVKVATHGYQADACGDSVQCLRKAFHAQEDCNFISIDWSKYSKNILYDQAALAVKPVGIHISKFLRFLRDETKFDIKKLHVIGHSLGAQVVSFASDEFPNEKVGRITGTDPAGPIFQNLPNKERLDASDAHFVDVIHTNTIYLGIFRPSGTVDYYVNGGNNQPGCDKWDFFCHHNMAHRYITHSVKNNKNFDSVKCKDLKEAVEGKCNGEKAPMGIGATAAKPGIYYTKIDKAPEFC
ncbi:UNVERIFIED_CONTAM: hypothetical protein PYX00_001964 [Menopon gallinae]|uniref:Lipase domain-containing protein n=1 Tax=Menopon gallinae TaxID=328185 RepID=A0AAW2IER7_9NEOP